MLVVEDDEDLRELLVEFLSGHGLLVAEARNGREALDYLASATGHVQAIILDFGLPHVDGRAFIAAVREDPRVGTTPILLITGMPDPDLLGKELGVPALSKPLDVDRLLAWLDAVPQQGLSRVR